MKLIEFDLDAPHLPKADRATFGSKSRSTTALYERFFVDLKTDDCWKVLVQCVTKKTRTEPITALGVTTVQAAFDFARYENLKDSHAQRRAFADALFRGTISAAKVKGWPREPFEQAARQILDLKLINQWWWKKPKWNPRRTLRGQLWCEHTVDSFRGYLVIKDKSETEVLRKKIIDTLPSEFVFAKLFGVARWSNSNTFTLLSKSKTEVGSITC